jgi:ketosteroid isomerase-like protein
MQHTRTLLITLTMALSVPALFPGQSLASEKSDVADTVSKFLDAFNKGDTETAAAVCAEETSIIDEFPPHEWHGAGGCAKWMAAYDEDAKKNGISDGIVTLGKPRHIDVTGHRAYVVIPATYVYKKQGTEEKEVGSILTVALHKEKDTGWHITGWSWAKH